MDSHLVLTVTGPDRPGLIRDIAQEIAAAGGNWLESRMASLEGRFAGVVLCAAPEAQAGALAERLGALRSLGLRLEIERVARAGARTEPARSLTLELLGQDHPGIVRDIARVLTAQKISVEELETETVSGSFSGETMFKATARLSLPAEVQTDALRAALEELADELMVDISLGDAAGG
jgi:glycine cleavage system regulatory protein